MIDDNFSMMNTEELTQIKDHNKKFLYARAVHANHMIQYHMHEISECQRVVDEYRFMTNGGKEMIPLESDKYKSDLVVNQHIMKMIDTDMHWYQQTFREILMELQKIRNGETPTKTSEESNETAIVVTTVGRWLTVSFENGAQSTSLLSKELGGCNSSTNQIH